MRTITAKTYRGLRNKGRTCIMGTTPHLVNQDITVPVRVVPECGQRLRVEAYGGGVRWYCPRCDRGYFGRIPSITYTNSPPPADGICHRPG
jgi:hypothetical protein